MQIELNTLQGTTFSETVGFIARSYSLRLNPQEQFRLIR